MRECRDLPEKVEEIRGANPLRVSIQTGDLNDDLPLLRQDGDQLPAILSAR